MLWLWRAPGSETGHFLWDIALARRIMYDIGRRGSSGGADRGIRRRGAARGKPLPDVCGDRRCHR